MIDRLDPLPLEFSHVGIFPAPHPVIFLAPTVTQPLLDLHTRVNRLLDRIGDQPDPFYLPGQWDPHCTLAIEFDPIQGHPALDVILRRAPLLLKGWAAELCLIEFSPVNMIFRLPLKTQPKE